MNTAGRNGGGAYHAGRQGWREIINCTFYGNTAGSGGGVYNDYGDSDESDRMELYNTVLWANSSSESGDQVYNSSNTVDIKNSDVEGGAAGIVNDGGTVNYDVSNKNVDPEFTQAPSAADEGNLYLQPGSPCVEAGNPVLAPDLDIEGNKRFRKKLVVTDNVPSEVPKGVNIGAYEDNRFAMAVIPAGSFYMGQSDPGIYGTDATSDEQPVRQVTITQPCLMDKTEVTMRQFMDLMGYNPGERTYESGTGGIGSGLPHWGDYTGFSLSAQSPVVRLDWLEAALYCNERTKAEAIANPGGGLTMADTVYMYSAIVEINELDVYDDEYQPDVHGTLFRYPLDFEIDYTAEGYRLPTEAEWEFACRAGTKTRYYWGDVFVHATAQTDPGYVYSWGTIGGNGSFHTVGMKVPNAFGLYDMAGNTGEWCGDWYTSTYGAEPVTDPKGAVGALYDTQYDVDEASFHDYFDFQDKVTRGSGEGPYQTAPYAFRSADRYSNGLYDMHIEGACYRYPGFRCVRKYQGTPPASIIVPEEAYADVGSDLGTVPPQGFVRIVRPVAGGTYTAGEALTVTWEFIVEADAVGVDIYLSTDDGRTWGEALNSKTLEATTRTFSFVPTVSSSTCRIKVEAYTHEAGDRTVSETFIVQ